MSPNRLATGPTCNPRVSELLGLYLRMPRMPQNGSLRPTAQGTPLARDAWLLGIGLSFVLNAVLSRGDDSG